MGASVDPPGVSCEGLRLILGQRGVSVEGWGYVLFAARFLRPVRGLPLSWPLACVWETNGVDVIIASSVCVEA